MKKFLTPLIFSAWLLAGCSLIPKNVEFFQSKVHKFPQPTAKQSELQREAAALAKQKAAETVDAALQENSSPAVVSPARDAEKLTDAVSGSLGPPAHAYANTTNLVNSLNKAVAKHDNKVESFAKENDKDAGKKIEGTGLIQVPYFIYLGAFLIVAVIGWHLAKTALTAAQAAGIANPAVGAAATVAVGGMNVLSSTLSKGLHQIVQGGEDFKTWVENEIPDAAIQAKVLDAFRANQITAQDEDVQAVVKQLTK